MVSVPVALPLPVCEPAMNPLTEACSTLRVLMQAETP
jgi:hypothetical protein